MFQVNDPGGAGVLDADTTVTVGSGGDYATINAALTALSASYPLYKAGGYTVAISLLTGFVMAEQVLVCGVDLSYIKITSVDAEVVISRAALTDLFEGVKTAFGATDSGKLPKIEALFSMDTSGSADSQYGAFLFNGATSLFASGAGIKNSTQTNVAAFGQCDISAKGAIFTGAVGGSGVVSSDGSRILNEGGSASGASFGYQVLDGSTIAAKSATGALSQTANGPATANGIIFQ